MPLSDDRRPLRERMADALRCPALVEAPESIHRHDPETTRAFNLIFEHPDNADLARAFPVGLAINDPAKPVEEEAPKKVSAKDAPVEAHGTTFSSQQPEADGVSMSGIRFSDADGDTIAACHVTANNGDDSRERIVLRINNLDDAVALTHEQADALVDFLDVALHGPEDEEAGA